MKWTWTVMVVACAGLLAFGCSKGTSPPDDGGVDGDTDGGLDGGDDGGADGGDLDGGQDGGGDMVLVPAQTRLSITGGGGTAQSENHKLRLHIGAPQPFGTATGQGKTIQMGPKATP